MADQPARWRRSSRCESHTCVEVAFTSGRVLARDSKVDDGPVLEFGAGPWQAFCAELKAGRLRG
ncbi:hypothetical protein GCM10027280_24720 [Micromonospora polyrhachis]|uniref:DUF397 domain-containing protein n=1 Tax=Micromonospora polyrhachis TaxID=1282883 RepID=A0A7W7SVL2_9ACTN|nr:DUF397 domain-containing protein [Micromonospora polyrhachis]MBB4960435.1 hypothetical protein [Micromonospora polyrhachis]